MSAAPEPVKTAKKAAAMRACELVEPGMRLGLGSGSTSALMVRRLGERVAREGLRVVGVPTSSDTETLARSLGIELTTLDETPRLDLTLDGADEIDPAFALIKGGGGALLHEKIVAAASERMVVMADPSKRVARLGAFPLPVEVVPFGFAATEGAVRSMLDSLGYAGAEMVLRRNGATAMRTDEGNLLLDCRLGAIAEPAALDVALKSVPGVVETGLFVDLADALVLGHEDGRAELHLREA